MTMLMRQEATFTMHGAAPMPIMFQITLHSRLKIPRRKVTGPFDGLKKCAITKTMQTAMAMSVAMAAPFMPQRNT